MPSDDPSEPLSWTRKSLRKVPTSPEIRSLGTPAGDISTWRHQLRSVEKSEEDTRPNATTPSAVRWRRSLSSLRHLPKSDTEKGKACIFCHPSELSSSKESEANPHLGHHKHAVGSHNHLHHVEDYLPSDHGSVTPRLRLKQIEQSLALKNAEDFLNTTTSKAEDKVAMKYETRQSRHHKTSSHSSYESIIKVLKPKTLASAEHLCNWRTRYTNLSTEHDQLKTEMDSHLSLHHGPQVEKRDAKIGTSFIRHKSPEIGIKGLTIVMHMTGKDDLVINTDLNQE